MRALFYPAGAPPKEHVLMTRSILSGLLGLIGVVTVGSLPMACQSGGIGDPCIPEDEYNANFAGFKMNEENIESRSFQCATRICLVNHFQGRVSCPLGQPPLDTGSRKACTGTDDMSCGDGETCVQAGTLAPECVPSEDPTKNPCAGTPGTTCDSAKRICVCDPSNPSWPTGYSCDADGILKSYVCHKKGNCQTADSADNTGKDCCIPGTDRPVTASVCGQCAEASKRDAKGAVYCSCRCGPPEKDGDPNTNDIDPDDDFNYCTCPDGFTCSEIRKDVGLGDAQITGKYCIKQDTEWKSEAEAECGDVAGYYDTQQCQGFGTAPTQ